LKTGGVPRRAEPLKVEHAPPIHALKDEDAAAFLGPPLDLASNVHRRA
jgi:hypothetical protein